MSVPRKGLVLAVEKAIRGGVVIRTEAPTPSSRLERLGTIFSRVTGLIKSNIIQKSDIPLWYNVYQAFPPKYEPRIDRLPVQNIKITQIFYTEDNLRACLKKSETLDLCSNQLTIGEIKVREFRKLRRNNPDSSNEELIKEVLK